MAPTVLGLHHVTATVAEAQPDLDFYRRLLGLRLVKKTVNFDNHHVYHFYYGNEIGTPGTIMTTFPYAGTAVAPGRKGAGQITATAFSVPADSLDRWRERFAGAGVDLAEEGVRFGEPFLRVADPSSLAIELIGTPDPRPAWTGGPVDPAIAIRGLHGVSLALRDPARSLALLAEPLGGSVTGAEGTRTRVGLGTGGPGRWLDLLHAPDAPAAVNGLGTVHHVAMAIETGEEQLAIREDLLRRGLSVTEVRDRQYFTSIYFREPGGVLYEIATQGPGFAIDEPVAELGRDLKLPPWEEANRESIERVLPTLRP